MTPTLEVRWFRPGPIPDAVQVWFDGLGAPVDAESRTDRYLIPTESEDLGLKMREGRIEAKQRVERRASVSWGPTEARPEAWRKWSLGLATDAQLETGWVDVSKSRRQRWLRVGDTACSLELATVSLGDTLWWSVCLEASGGDADGRQRVLEDAASRWLDRSEAPVLPAQDAMGYPAWLRREAG